MKILKFLVFFFWGLIGGQALGAPPRLPSQSVAIDETRFMIQYRQTISPYEEYGCKAAKAEIGVYEYTVICEVDGQKKRYNLHLMVNFFPRTNLGVSAYEVLYWTTDWQDTSRPVNNNATLWIHNSTEENRIKIIELGLSVDDDLAELHMTLKPPH